MEKKKIRITSLIGGRLEALNRLMNKNFTSWGKTRDLVRLYQSVTAELEAFDMAIAKLRGDFPEGGASAGGAGDEYERRVKALDEAEIELGVISLSESDFFDPKDVPTPADMLLLSPIIDFDYRL